MQHHSFTNILTSHRMHAFVELPRPNVASKLLAIATLDSCRADTRPVSQAMGSRLHITIITTCTP